MAEEINKDQPTVLYKTKEASKFKLLNFLSVKLILAILGIFILVEIGYTIFSLSLWQPQPKTKNQKIQPISYGKIVLSSDKTNYKISEEGSVSVKLYTGGHTVEAADIIVNFDPEFLDIQRSDITRGKIFNDYPSMKVGSNNGVLAISGVTSLNKLGFNGMDEFAKFKFKTKQIGKTKLSINFKDGLTKDSNILLARSPKDILKDVYNLELTIDNRGSGITQALGESCTGFIQSCLDEEGRIGTQECNGGKKSQNSCIWDPQKTINCKGCEINL